VSAKVSICLPLYNGARFLKQAIESIIYQDFEDFELLIADDASTDESYEIASDYSTKDKRVFCWCNKERLGLFNNYNLCIERAKGEYIKPFAQDDLLETSALAKMTDVLDGFPKVSLVSCAKRWIDKTGASIKQITQFEHDCSIPGKDVIIANLILLTNWIGEPSAVMFRSKYKGNGFDPHYYHYGDIEYWFRILEHGDLYYLSDSLCNFRKHEKSSTTTNLAGLYFASDIVRLGYKYEKYLIELGESQDHFGARAAEVVALHLDHLVRKEDLSIEEVVQTNPSFKNVYYTDEVAEFRRALFYAERRITSLMEELIATQNELEHRQAECLHLQTALNQMNRSVSWRLTAPLRNVRQRLGQPEQ